MARVRADLLLLRRGLAESRAKAQDAIREGRAFAGGEAIGAVSALIEEDAPLRIDGRAYVSRAALKLEHGLAVFGVEPRGRVCFDIGASTGGFTEVLLEHGARRVYAVDVGQGQLHERLRADPRVVCLERTDARGLTRGQAPEAADLIVCDASFIGLEKVLPQPLALAAEHAELIALVKPQFEAGPGSGEVLAEGAARRVAGGVIAALDGLAGMAVRAFADSPVRGRDGNLEILAYFTR